MRIAIIGAGAMGCLFAARLHHAGCSVTLLEVDPLTLETLQRNGVTLHMGDVSSVHHVPAMRAEQAKGRFDLIMLFTKAFSTLAAVRSVRHLLGETSWVLTLQNGIGHVQDIASCVPEDRILVGVTDIPADLSGTAQVRSEDAGSIRFWHSSGPRHSDLELIAGAFVQAGFSCEPDPNVQVAVWQKAAFNAALNSLCTLLKEPVGHIAASDDGQWLVQQVIAETANVARASGASFSEQSVLAAVAQAYARQAAHRPSMLQDRLAGRQTEIEYINGAIVRQGRLLGIATPVLESLYRLVRMGENR